ncbi:type II toxin-antitoxin system RelE/ParE family toxin [Legionella sp. CNM-1927-20]|uniref:type II toxin-antitoxin system RelE/ParE family toxin n=1 Tax=Legionella sp. CNM-1927-20 TaxID=3422221 RepID=UPI00403AE0EC
MLEIVRSSQFKRDLKKIIKQRKELGLLQEIVELLQKLEPLPPKIVIILFQVIGKGIENAISRQIGYLYTKLMTS